MDVLAVSSNKPNSPGTWNERRMALCSGLNVGVLQETFANRAVTTAEDVEQATEERKLIATSQGFLETSFFFSYQEARNILLHG